MLLALVVALAGIVAVIEGAGTVMFLDIQSEILTPHNTLRNKYCVGPLTWSPELAVVATNYLLTCPSGHNANRQTDYENALRAAGMLRSDELLLLSLCEFLFAFLLSSSYHWFTFQASQSLRPA
jgi:hypothetical protein